MKRLSKLLPLLPLLLLVMCKKKDLFLAEGTLTAKEFVYNNAIQKFEPEETVGGKLQTNFEMKTVYYYLQRQGKTDTLLQIDFPADAPTDYDFTVKPASWAGVRMQGVKALKVLAVRDNNTTVEKIVSLTYFDPAAPVISEFPETLTPNLTGITNITGKISSATGISKVNFYDNHSGSFELVGTVEGNNSKELPVNFSYEYNEGAGQLKVEVVDIYELKAEKVVQFVNIPFKPVITFAGALKLALPDGKPEVKGTIKSFTELSTVNVYFVKSGGATLHKAITPLLESSAPNEFNYSFTVTDFPFAEDVTGCRLEASDVTGTSNNTEPIEILPYYYWKNLTMMAQGNATTASTSCFFLGEPGRPVIGPCAANADPSLHTKIYFAMFCNSTPMLAFNNPSVISAGTLSTFKCEGVNWDPPLPNASTLMKTTFRVLSGNAEITIRQKLDNWPFDNLSDAFFTGASAPTANAPNSSTYAANSLIYVKAVTQGTPAVTKNMLIKVLNVDVVGLPNQATSTITFDILKEK